MTSEDRILALEDRVTVLEEALGLTYEPPVGLGLTRFEAAVVGVILKTKIASRDKLWFALYGDRADPPTCQNVDVFVSRARSKLRAHGVTINNTWGVGYWIPAEQKARLLDACDS